MSALLPPSVLDSPTQPPPPGETSDFVHGSTREHAIYAVAGICLPLILISAAFRLYAKWRILPRKWLDEVTCIFAIFAGILYICLSIAAVSGGPFGAHAWDIQIKRFTKAKLVLTLLTQALCGPCFWFIKLSLFILYIRVFNLIRWLRVGALAGIIVTGLFYFATMISSLVLCSPRNDQSQFSYLITFSSAKCIRSRDIGLAIGAVNAVSDLYLLLLPLPPLWSLQMPLKKKMGIAVMVSTGLIAVFASILALVYRVKEYESQDDTWDAIPVWLTTIIEMTAGIVLCCMPTTAAVFKHFHGVSKTFSLSSSRRLAAGSSQNFAKSYERKTDTPSYRHHLEHSMQQKNSQYAERSFCNDTDDWDPESISSKHSKPEKAFTITKIEAF